MPTLHWLTRETDLKLSGLAPYRLLEAVDEHSYGDPTTGNMLIQGDNLDALKALLPYYAGAVKCIYIDPPYNTKSAFEHYDDNLEHTKWLSIMYPRLELLRELLAENGSIWVSIDDNEAHYLKVLLDEIFGRNNFVANVLWQKRTSPDARLALGAAHDHLLVYGKSVEDLSINKLSLSGLQAGAYKNPDNDPKGAWVSTDFTGQTGHATPSQFYSIITPTGKAYPPPPGRCWAIAESTFLRLVQEGRVWFGKQNNSRPRLKRYLSEATGVSSWTWWTNTEVGHNQESKKEINLLFSGDDQFDTPKPERLLGRVLELATHPADLVLDSFLGSGTTAAVAHKMGRRYIGIEMGEHAITHCVPRLCKVIDGEQGGISQAVNWQGGGGFRFYRLGEPIFDDDGSIRKGIKYAQLGAHVWFSETKTPLTSTPDSPLLGIHEGTAYYLLYNGILKDKSVGGGNVLTAKILEGLPAHDGPKVIYGERCLFSATRLKEKQITFKHTPYDIKGR